MASRRDSSGITESPMRGRMRYPLTINSRGLAALLALGLTIGTATAASAQVFLAAKPHPEFKIGPLILTGAVPRNLGPVQVNVSWSLSVPNPRVTVPHDPLYLLWPREIAAPTAQGAADPEVA